MSRFTFAQVVVAVHVGPTITPPRILQCSVGLLGIYSALKNFEYAFEFEFEFIIGTPSIQKKQFIALPIKIRKMN